MNIPQNITCHACGAATMKRVEEDQVFETAGGRRIKTPGFVFLRCPACGEESVPMASARATSRHVAGAMQRMKAEEVAQFLKLTKLTPEKASRKIGSTADAVRAWLSGRHLVPSTHSILMRVFMAHPEMLRLAGNAKKRSRPGPKDRVVVNSEKHKLVEKHR